MIGLPKFENNPNVIFEHGRYIISPTAKLNDKERKILQKQILEYRKVYLNHLNRSIYMGYLKMDKNGDYYLTDNAPKPLVDYFNNISCKE